MKLKIPLILILSSVLLFSFFFSFNLKKNNNELVFWTLQLGSFDFYIKNIIAEFEHTHPNVKIKWVDVPYSEGEKRTLAALLSDNPPDLINLTPDFSVLAAQKNALMEIPKNVMSDFPASLHKSLSYNGKFFAIPFYATSAITFANSDLMKKYGIESIPKTYDELYNIAVKHNLNGVFIDMPTVNENDTFVKILNKNNINIYDNISSPQSVKIFEMYKDLYLKNLIPKESITQGHREALEKYISGQIIFLQAGANFLNIIKENAPDIFDKTVLSNQITGTSGLYDFSVMNLIIPLKAKHKKDALDFAVFLTNKYNQIQFAKLISILPVNSMALQDDFFKKFDSKEDIARNLSSSQLMNTINPIENKRCKKNIILLINNSLVEILTGKDTTDNIINNLNNKIKEIQE